MLKKSLVLVLLLSGSLLAQQKAATDLPNISLIGNFLGEQSHEKGSFNVKEIEFAFQHYLYPSVKADVFASLHKESNETHLELEEGFLTFFDVPSLVAPNFSSPVSFGAIVGKKLLPVGKENALHPEQLPFVDRALSNQYFFASEHGLAGEGVILNTLLPTPFYASLELGYAGLPHEPEAESEHTLEPGSIDSLTHLRHAYFTKLSTSFKPASSMELETGLSYLGSQVGISETHEGEDTAHTHRFNTSTYVLDMTLSFSSLGVDKYKLRSELYHNSYNKTSSTGGFVYGVYRPSKQAEFGLRYAFIGSLNSSGAHDDALFGTALHPSVWSIISSYNLTETSKIRLQYSFGNRHLDSAVFVQLIFGMGPHSHVLN